MDWEITMQIETQIDILTNRVDEVCFLADSFNDQQLLKTLLLAMQGEGCTILAVRGRGKSRQRMLRMEIQLKKDLYTPNEKTI
jgi:hypothetical protein